MTTQPLSPAAVMAFLGLPRQSTPIRSLHLVAVILITSPIYGLAMGLHDPAGDRWLYALFAAIKLPLMVLTTGAVCLPGFVVLSTLRGLGTDLRAALRAILASQASVSIALASLAPVTLFFYASGVSHRGALIVSGIMFLIATLVGQAVLLRHYRPLLAQSRRHAVMLAYWLIAYIFVGIQMGWMLRPFVGTPGAAPTFFRAEPFSNAYIVVLRLITGS